MLDCVIVALLAVIVVPVVLIDHELQLIDELPSVSVLVPVPLVNDVGVMAKLPVLNVPLLNVNVVHVKVLAIRYDEPTPSTVTPGSVLPPVFMDCCVVEVDLNVITPWAVLVMVAVDPIDIAILPRPTVASPMFSNEVVAANVRPPPLLTVNERAKAV